jgi:hypothetical protein
MVEREMIGIVNYHIRIPLQDVQCDVRVEFEVQSVASFGKSFS